MRLTIQEAAQKLDLPPQAVRVWLQKPDCPFGTVIHDKKQRCGRRTYFISSERLDAYLMKGE